MNGTVGARTFARTWRTRSRIAALCLLAAVVGCGDGNDDPDDGFSVTVAKGTARIRCSGGDCAVGVVFDGGFANVGGTRTVDGVATTRFLLLTQLTNVEIETGAGNDSVQLVDAFIPGTVRISTGTGDDRFDLCDSSAAGDTRIDAGDGVDRVSVGPGAYGRRLLIHAGPGGDFVRLQSLFVGGDLVADGDEGVDEVDISNATFAGGVDLDGFEHRPGE